MKKILVLGSSGMLGTDISIYLKDHFNVTEVNRHGAPVDNKNQYFDCDVIKNFELLTEHIKRENYDYVFNSIGKVKQQINEKSKDSISEAFLLNSDFSNKLDYYSQKLNFKLIQIGTDCVFSGERGNYTEDDNYDATDIYGKSKIEGELNSPNSMFIRCSIIGEANQENGSLISWFLGNSFGARVKGFTNHLWNGISCLGFAKIIKGIIETDSFEKGKFHLLPKDFCSKYELLILLAKYYKRDDLKIEPFETSTSIDRRLQTINHQRNLNFWRKAGFGTIPSIEALIQDFRSWKKIKAI